MTTKTILQHAQRSGLDTRDATELIEFARLIANDTNNELTYWIWQFREEKAGKLASPYGAMTHLMDYLRKRPAGDAAWGQRVVFIAHAVDGDVPYNLAEIRRIVRTINTDPKRFPATLPFVPYYADVVALEDADPAERAIGLANCHHILKTGVVQELWLCGQTITAGMQLEVELCHALGIPVVDQICKL